MYQGDTAQFTELNGEPQLYQKMCNNVFFLELHSFFYDNLYFSDHIFVKTILPF